LRLSAKSLSEKSFHYDFPSAFICVAWASPTLVPRRELRYRNAFGKLPLFENATLPEGFANANANASTSAVSNP